MCSYDIPLDLPTANHSLFQSSFVLEPMASLHVQAKAYSSLVVRRYTRHARPCTAPPEIPRTHDSYWNH